MSKYSNAKACLIILLLALATQSSQAIQCYVCNTLTNGQSDCADTFSKNSAYLTTCTSAYPICTKYADTNNGIYIRSCNNQCIPYSSSGYTETCCNTSGCNFARSSFKSNPMLMTLGLAVVVLGFKLRML